MVTPTVKVRRSATPGKIPTTGQVALGELAINTHDGKIFLKKNVGGTETMVSFGGTTENKLLDDISASFNGTATQFTLSSSATNFLNTEITSVAKLLISVGGIIQEPDQNQGAGFYISGGTDLVTDPVKINFVEAPKSGQPFFGIVFGTSTASENVAVTPEQAIAYSIMFGV